MIMFFLQVKENICLHVEASKPLKQSKARRNLYFQLLCFMISGAGVHCWIQRRPHNAFHGSSIKDHRRSYFHNPISGKKLDGIGSELASSVAPDNKPSTETAKQNGKKSSGWIDGDDLNRLQESVDIISFIETYGLQQFERKGDNRATAVCPFHDDHSPSLSIDGNRRIYKCFACGAGGNVFKFAQEYSKIQGEEVSFYEAVKRVNNHYDGGGVLDLEKSSFSNSSPRMSEQERKELQAKKERLYLVNAASAAYYIEQLTLPFAGGARAYLQTRGFLPNTVRTFGMGFAPDSYYGPQVRTSTAWGEGSLVNHLKDLGFKPSEILDAGLAIRTKNNRDKPTEYATEKESNSTAAGTSKENDEIAFDMIMDRFRGRLVVPIFDASGKRVVAFGGRILPPNDSNKNGLYIPKYLNSPESLLFQKKNILFGHHTARDAIQSHNQQSKVVGKVQQPTSNVIVVVEGYLDAVSLWQAGFRSVVASMGTALSSEQLALAAKTVGPNGRLILCLDNDEAGMAAVDRLCTNTMLSKIKHSVDICVASLPDKIKDPAEFIDSCSDKQGGKAAALFKEQVIDTATEWTDWYLHRILSRYNEKAPRGDPGSFGEVFDRAAEFLATTFPNAADRTKRAYEIAGTLATLMANQTNASSVSNAARIQLESDLIDLTSRKVETKLSIQRRAESIATSSGDGEQGSRAMLASLSRGTQGKDDLQGRLSKKALKEITAIVPKYNGTMNDFSSQPSDNYLDQMNEEKTVRRFTGQKRRRERMTRKNVRSARRSPEPTLTEHFSGFEWEHKSDSDWLGISQKKKGWNGQDSGLILGINELQKRSKNGRLKKNGNGDIFVGKPVFFNSNDYHGNTFITDDALSAGYSNNNDGAASSTTAIQLSKQEKEEIDIANKGVTSMIRQNVDEMTLKAEESLLYTLVNDKSARYAIKNTIKASIVNNEESIEWSNPDRKWLFHCLVLEDEEIIDALQEDSGIDRAEAIRSELSNRHDVPAGAFGTEKVRKPQQSEPSPDPISTSNESSDKISLDRDLDFQALSSSEQISSSSPLQSDKMTLIEVESNYPIAGSSSDEEVCANIKTSSDNFVDIVVSDELELRSGSLDMFFTNYQDMFDSAQDDAISHEKLAEFAAQEFYITLVLCTSQKKVNAIKNELSVADQALMKKSSSTNATLGNTDHVTPSTTLYDEADGPFTSTSATNQDNSNGERNYDQIGISKNYYEMEIEKLRKCCNQLASELQKAMSEKSYIEEAAHRISLRLMDYSTTDGVEGRLSFAYQQELAKDMDDYVLNLEKTALPSDSEENDSNVNTVNNDSMTDIQEGESRARAGSGYTERLLGRLDTTYEERETVEEAMSRMEEEWGEWSNDDYEWSIDHADEYYADPNILEEDEEEDFEERESLEDALARMEDEWSFWLTDDETSTANSTEVF